MKSDFHKILSLPDHMADGIMELVSHSPKRVVDDVANILIGISEKKVVDKLGVRFSRGLFGEFYSELKTVLESSQPWSVMLFSPTFQDIYNGMTVNPFHWGVRFSTVFEQDGGFDIIVGNPPFINCIRGSLSRFEKDYLKNRFSFVSGSADMSYYFLELASELIHKDGLKRIRERRVNIVDEPWLSVYNAKKLFNNKTTINTIVDYEFVLYILYKFTKYLLDKTNLNK